MGRTREFDKQEINPKHTKTDNWFWTKIG